MNEKVLFFLLIPLLGFSQVQIGQTIYGQAIADNFGDGVSISEDGNIVAVSTYADLNDNYIKVYRNNSGVWTQVGQTIFGQNSNEKLTRSLVSLSAGGSVLVISLRIGNLDYVRVYENIGGTWTQIGNDILGSTQTLSPDGYTLAVRYSTFSNIGVRIFKYISGQWTQVGQDIDGTQYGLVSSFGAMMSLSLTGDTIAIGASLNEVNGINEVGSVFIYKNISGVWTKIGQDINGSYEKEWSGTGVSISHSGNILAISSLQTRNVNNGYTPGRVRVYEYVSGNWIQVGNDINGAGQILTVSLSADGNVLAFGTKLNSNTIDNALRVYKNKFGAWTKIGNDVRNLLPYDLLGNSSGAISVSSDGNIVAVGAPYVKWASTPPLNYPKYREGYVQVWDYSKALSNNDFVLENFNIYPNPTSDVLNIDLESNLILDKVTIYNNLGQVVKTTIENVIDVSQLAKGLYFVEVITNQGKATKKVIVK